VEYVVALEKDAATGTVMVSFADFANVHSVGHDEADALREAVDALETAADMFIGRRELFPAPRKARAGELTVRLPAQVATKVLLHNEMVAQGIRKAELGRRLNLLPPQIDRLLNVRHSTKIETLEAALEAVGKHLVVGVG
jgi:antitoxin HicB